MNLSKPGDVEAIASLISRNINRPVETKLQYGGLVFKFTFGILLLGLSLASCSSISPNDLAKSHLEFVKAGKASEANQQYCNFKDSLILHSLKNFAILASQSKKEGSLSYTEITTKVDTDQTILKKVEAEGLSVSKPQTIKQITLEVWKSDDFYNKAVLTAAKLNDIGEKVGVLTGSPAMRTSNPVRSDFNKSSSCIFLPFNQFKNE